MAMTTFNPGQVLLGSGGSGPYLPNPDANRFNAGGNTVASTNVGGTAQVPMQPPNQPGSSNSESVRATGTGPFDAAYRQNLATYGGGSFTRPGGNFSFNPTDPNSFPGNPVGGGNAPLPGLPDSLISTAMGGNPFTFNPPQPAQPTQPTPATDSSNGNGIPDWQFWLQQFRNQGGGYMPFVQ